VIVEPRPERGWETLRWRLRDLADAMRRHLPWTR